MKRANHLTFIDLAVTQGPTSVWTGIVDREESGLQAGERNWNVFDNELGYLSNLEIRQRANFSETIIDRFRDLRRIHRFW